MTVSTSALLGVLDLRVDPAALVEAASMSGAELLALAIGPRPRWMAAAACAGMPPALFHPEGYGSKPWRALEVCARCAVVDECREWALAEPSMYWPGAGVAGGLTAAERCAVRDGRAVRRLAVRPSREPRPTERRGREVGERVGSSSGPLHWSVDAAVVEREAQCYRRAVRSRAGL